MKTNSVIMLEMFHHHAAHRILVTMMKFVRKKMVFMFIQITRTSSSFAVVATCIL